MREFSLTNRSEINWDNFWEYDLEFDWDKNWENDVEFFNNARGKNPVKMLVDEDFDDDWCPCMRRPYYQLRGKPVSPEQAMEILIRTESLWSWEFDGNKTLPCYVGSALFRNSCYNIPLDWRTGWVHPDGTIGQNDMTGFKYPEIREMMEDIVPIVTAFPYLDFFAGLSYRNEQIGDQNDWHPDDWEEYQKEGFTALIECGIWVHDSTIEIVNENKAKELYKTYEKLYEVPNKAIYESDYHTTQEPLELDWNYFRKALELVKMPDLENFLAEYEKRLKKRAEQFRSFRGWYDKVLDSKPTTNGNS